MIQFYRLDGRRQLRTTLMCSGTALSSLWGQCAQCLAMAGSCSAAPRRLCKHCRTFLGAWLWLSERLERGHAERRGLASPVAWLGLV